jgi:hypothetical protein
MVGVLCYLIFSRRKGEGGTIYGKVAVSLPQIPNPIDFVCISSHWIAG